MTTRISRMFRQNEAGFTIIEMMVALVLIGGIAIGAAAGIFHLLNTNSTNANTVTVTTNINSATDSLVPDVQTCNIGITGEEGNYLPTGIGQAEYGGMTDWDQPGSETGTYILTGMGAVGTETKWLCLEWEWEDISKQPEYHQVTYDIVEGRLYRHHRIYKGKYDSEGKLLSKYENKTSETSTMVAQNIDEGATNWRLIYDEGTNDVTVEITITATASGYKSASESRTIKVVPRVQLPPADS